MNEQEKGHIGSAEGVAGAEPVKVQPQNFTIASVTFQVFFKYYKKLAGMSVSRGGLCVVLSQCFVSSFYLW